MRKLYTFLLVGLLVLSIDIEAQQQRPIQSLYMFDQLLINPAYAGSQVQLSATSIYRNQWVNLDGAPETFTASVQSSLMNNRMGLGVVLGKDVIGVHEDLSFFASYAYRIPMPGGASFSMGLQAGFDFLQSDFTRTTVPSANPSTGNPGGTADPYFNATNAFNPNFGAGVFYTNRNYYIGISVPYLLENDIIQDVETGERFDLFDKVMASVSNPEIRRMELMAQMAGIERVAKERGDIGMFITLTCPSKYHPTKQRKEKNKETGKDDYYAVLNHKWKDEAYTPKDGQRYLVKVWSRIRSAFNDNNINIYGVRVVEPHHDGTPHWHMLLFVDKASRAKAIDIMRKRALKEDGNEAGAQKYRFECKHMNRGGAVGYIAKYIAKNIDGYALDGEVDHETGKDLKSMAAAVTAWASTWRIPQFQFYKLPSKGAYRECRRLPRGVSIADKLGDVAERVRAAADQGKFDEYIMSQGGPCIRRREETIRVAREVSDVNVYGEEVQKVVGVYHQLKADAPVLKTRERKYQIVKKSDVDVDFNLLKSDSGATRSPVNNCRSRITSNLSDVQFYEPEHGSGEVCNIQEYGFAFIETDEQNAAESEISRGKQQRQVSNIELSESDKEIQSEIINFANEVGINFDIPQIETMFINGLGVSDGLHFIKIDGGRLRLGLNEDGKELQRRELEAQKEVIQSET